MTGYVCRVHLFRKLAGPNTACPECCKERAGRGKRKGPAVALDQADVHIPIEAPRLIWDDGFRSGWDE